MKVFAFIAKKIIPDHVLKWPLYSRKESGQPSTYIHRGLHGNQFVDKYHYAMYYRVRVSYDWSVGRN